MRIAFCFLYLMVGFKALSQTDYFKNSVWFKAPMTEELKGKYWLELTDKQGLGFEYTNQIKPAYLFDMNHDRTTLYTGWAKWMPYNTIEELTFFVLGKCVARFTYRDDRSVEMMEWTSLPFMDELWRAKTFWAADKALESILTFISQSNAESFDALTASLKLTLERKTIDGFIPLGYKVTFDKRGFTVEENLTGLSNKAFGAYNQLNCYDYNKIPSTQEGNGEGAYISVVREYKEGRKNIEIRNSCSLEELDKGIMHLSVETFHQSGSVKTESSLLYHQDELKGGSHVEFLPLSDPSKTPPIRCKLDDINGRGIGECIGDIKLEMRPYHARALSLITQLSFNKSGRIEDADLFKYQSIAFNPPNVEDPEYPGGYPAMVAFFQKNLNYPQVAQENNIQGKCYVKFVVNGNGSVSSVQVERGIAGCPECDKEAIRLVKMMPGWKPGKVNGKSVPSWFRLPINFALE